MSPKQPRPSGEMKPAERPVPERAEHAPEMPVIAKGTRDDLDTQARRATAGLRDDLSAIAHDLKNPLSVILLEVTALEQRMGRAVPAVQHGLERIAQNTLYVERLVSDLLDLVSSDEGRLELRTDRVDLALMLDETIERAVATNDRHRVLLDVRDTPILAGDGMRLERVVANLIDNALKHAPKDTSVTVRLDERDGCACVSVIDSGPGLQPHELDACFERYHRGPHEHGHGLGLYICRKIIEAHRGRIGVQSAPGRGARFYFLLPR